MQIQDEEPIQNPTHPNLHRESESPPADHVTSPPPESSVVPCRSVDRTAAEEVEEEEDYSCNNRNTTGTARGAAQLTAATKRAGTVEEDWGWRSSSSGPRERLKRHRVEVSGRVWIPDIWGHEDFLHDWIGCAPPPLDHSAIAARASLMEEAKRRRRLPSSMTQ